MVIIILNAIDTFEQAERMFALLRLDKKLLTDNWRYYIAGMNRLANHISKQGKL